MPFLVAVDENDIGEGNLQIKPGTSNVLEPYGKSKVYKFNRRKGNIIFAAGAEFIMEVDAPDEDISSIIKQAEDNCFPTIELEVYNSNNPSDLGNTTVERSLHMKAYFTLRYIVKDVDDLYLLTEHDGVDHVKYIRSEFGDMSYFYVFCPSGMIHLRVDACYLDVTNKRLYYGSSFKDYLLPLTDGAEGAPSNLPSKEGT